MFLTDIFSCAVTVWESVKTPWYSREQWRVWRHSSLLTLPSMELVYPGEPKVPLCFIISNHKRKLWASIALYMLLLLTFLAHPSGGHREKLGCFLRTWSFPYNTPMVIRFLRDGQWEDMKRMHPARRRKFPCDRSQSASVSQTLG